MKNEKFSKFHFEGLVLLLVHNVVHYFNHIILINVMLLKNIVLKHNLV